MKNESPDLLEFLKDILSALMFLSKIPIPWDKISETPPDFNRSFWAFPLVGFILGIISGLLFLILFYIGLPIIISVTIGVFFSIILTGALHEDGLADTIQGFSGGKDREHILELMRSSNIGTYGALSLIILVFLKIGTLSSLGMQNYWYVFSGFIVSGAIGRSMIVFLRSISEPISNSDVNELSKKMEGSILWSSLGLAFLITVIFSPFWVAIIGFTLCIIQTYGVMAYADKKIGGVTGDILGANEQISEINFLIIFSAIYGSL